MALSRRSSSRPGRSRFTLLLLVLTSVTVLTLDFRGAGVVDDLRDGATTVFGPVRDAGAWVGSPFADAWNGVFGYDELADENEQLQARVDELEGQAARAEDIERQLDEIDELEGIDRWTEVPTVLAQVTGGSLSNFQHTVEIDKGSDHGLVEGMPVVTGAGLVGRLTEVASTRSVVQLVSDPTFDVGVRLARTGEVGIGHGAGEGNPFVVDEGIALTTEVHDRESVTTCGCARSQFPAGIPIGRVMTIGTTSDQLSQVLEISLLADLGDLSYVRIVLVPPEPEPAPATTATTAATATTTAGTTPP